MGFVADLFTGGAGGAADAARSAAHSQQIESDRAINLTNQHLARSRQDLSKYAGLGNAAIGEFRKPNGDLVASTLAGLAINPTNQQHFIKNNPFFKSLADDAQRRLFNNQAARGKVGSGETADALQSSLLRLGPQLVDQNIRQRSDLARIGLAGSGGQAAATGEAARSISDLITGKGNAAAAGQVGAANAWSQGYKNLLGTALTVGGFDV